MLLSPAAWDPRHKSFLPGLDLDNPADPFRKAYLPLIQKLIQLRSQDPAFYPGSDAFEFIMLSDTVCINHPFYKGNHTLFVGNISDAVCSVELDLAKLTGFSAMSTAERKGTHWKDRLSGKEFHVFENGLLKLKLDPYGMYWLT